MSTYGWVLLCTIAGPLALSFDKKIHFYTRFRPLFIAILPVSSFFLLWDAYFTDNHIWGFAEEHIVKIYLYNLPIEEVLFFFLVPYSCVFIYEVLIGYFPKLNLSVFSTYFSYLFIALGTTLILTGIGNWYTISACTISCLLVAYTGLLKKKKWFPYFSLTFTIALIPFLIVNGVLTGAITENPIVWYSENHIVGIRIITIPIEDLFYNASLLLPIIWIYEKIK
jgi:lycopene cyclase domain-containing protein